MKKSSLHIIFAAVLSLCAALVGCAHRSEADAALDTADALIESRPDSAFAILSAIDPTTLAGERREARYALLMSMALDKNYIDTTDFAVLQPAIDYYLTKGTPDERLRTLYYTGVIHKNRGERNEAMGCFMDAAELRNEVTDSLVLARNFVMQGVYYFDQYRIGSSTDKYLQAAQLYGPKRPDLALDCYLRALHGTLVKENKVRADSIIAVCEDKINMFPEFRDDFSAMILSYEVLFGTNQNLLSTLHEHRGEPYSDILKVYISRAYERLGDLKNALCFFNMINPDSTTIGLEQYNILKGDILYSVGNYKESTEAYRKYIDLSGRGMAELLNSSLPFSGKQHELKLQHDSEIRDRNRTILLSGLFASLLALVCLAISFGLYRQRAKRIISEQTNRNLQLELEKQAREKAKLELEKRASSLEIENLQLEKARLEGESENLRELLNEKKDLDSTVRAVIRNRLALLNSLFAQELTKNESLGAPYQHFIEQIQNDKMRFLESTRLAFSASHPRFIEYLENRGLTTEEIYFCCLYAIGLRGKDVGEYTGLKRHYIINSEIRRKLGLTEHQTNLNKYILTILKEEPANL